MSFSIIDTYSIENFIEPYENNYLDQNTTLNANELPFGSNDNFNLLLINYLIN